MKQYKSKNLSIPTLWRPLSSSLSIYSYDSSPLSQWYYNTGQEYEPDHTSTPLILTPQLSVIDAETHTEYSVLSNADIKWYVCTATNPYSSETGRVDGREGALPSPRPLVGTSVETQTEITVSTPGYSLFPSGLPTGSLQVNLNIPAGDGLHLRCRIVWADPRNGEVHEDVGDVTLDCMAIGESPFRIRLLRERLIRWNPLDPLAGSTQTIEAQMYRGSEILDNRDYWFYWYKVMPDGTRLLIDDDAAMCPACRFHAPPINPNDGNIPAVPLDDNIFADAASQAGNQRGGDVIDINMNFTNSLMVECRAISREDQQTFDRSTPITDLIPASDSRSLVWYIPEIDVEPCALNGAAVRPSTPMDMSFSALVRADGENLSSIAKRRVVVKWKVGKKQSTSWVETDCGTGMDITIPRSMVMLTGDSSLKDSASVYAEVYLQEALLPLVYDGKYIIDDNDKYVCGSVSGAE